MRMTTMMMNTHTTMTTTTTPAKTTASRLTTTATVPVNMSTELAFCDTPKRQCSISAQKLTPWGV